MYMSLNKFAIGSGYGLSSVGVTFNFRSQKMRSFDVFCVVSLNKMLNIESSWQGYLTA